MKKRQKIEDLRITIIDYIIWALITIVASYVICVVAGCFILGVGFKGIMYAMSHKTVLLAAFFVACIGYVPIVLLARWQFEHAYVMHRIRNAKKGIKGNLENSHFMNFQEMTKSNYRFVRSLNELKNSDHGILLWLEEGARGSLLAIFSPEVIHTLILATTGSGKTSAYIIPFIKAVSLTREATRPSFVFTDPKGELYDNTAWYLEKQGYKVLFLDFRHPEKSLRWNPMYYAWSRMEEARDVWDKCVTATDDAGKTKYDAQGNPIWKLYGREYTGEEIDQVIRAEVQRLEDEAFEEIVNITSALCPVSAREPIWDEGAKGFIRGVMLAMLEDGFSGDEEEMTLDKFNLYNVHHICTHGGSEGKELHKYFAFRSEHSRAVTSAQQVLSSPDKQQGSYLSSVQQHLQLFNDRAICNMTSGMEIDVKEMDERPTAVYLILPDEKEGRHPLGSLFLAQCYKKLVEKAIENGGRLKRDVYYVLDEYGNMPRIEGVQSMFTVGRSRGIIQMPVIQAYSQLTAKYGAELANTIVGNCNTEIFLGAKDGDTTEQYSKKLGNYMVMSSSATGGKHAVDHSFNESLRERPLMYPRELAQLNNKNNLGNAVIINQGYSPTLGTFTPYFKSKLFELGKTSETARIARALDEDEIFYDFTARAKTIIEGASAAMTQPADYEKEQYVSNEHIRTIVDVEKELTVYAEQLNKTLDDDIHRNIAVIEEMIALLQEQSQTLKCSEVIKLKAEYLRLINTEERGQV